MTHQGRQNGGIASTNFSDSVTAYYAESKSGKYTCTGNVSYNWGTHVYGSAFGLRI